MPIAPSTLRSHVEQIMTASGTPEAVVKLGVSREALARLVAGLPVRAGTLALVERALEKVK